MSGTTPTALVTGGGRGIGRFVALALMREGYRVAIAGRHLDSLESAAKEAMGAKGSAMAIQADVSNPSSVRLLFGEIQEKFGRLDLLFNNAGIFGPSLPLEDVTFEQWRAVVDTNLTGTFLCIQEAFRLMKTQTPRGGRIINNGSLSAYAPRPDSSPYTATKHGIAGLTKATSLDGRKYDIACGQIDIGNAATDMTEKIKSGVRQANGSIAIEPTIDPEHVARAVIYMASLPLDTNVQFLTVMPSKMPFVGRG